ncbi:hypothetical protein [Nonomuraea aridisoli]|uniref:Uncharacterized protein n=1 Tax=Nonomuraea aridisoli TaxID=2070368 RepID=A0A2W2EX94_9ACTN|nr:hypothetical protein [Nonomuraea aridisoli]PZG08924.1 hypothetical protein C1J01_38425 [Nonomuraea aridisoli]
MRNLSLGIPLYATDLTACIRCARPVSLRLSWKTLDGGRICLDCVTEQVEANRLATLTDRNVPF